MGMTGWIGRTPQYTIRTAGHAKEQCRNRSRVFSRIGHRLGPPDPGPREARPSCRELSVLRSGRGFHPLEGSDYFAPQLGFDGDFRFCRLALDEFRTHPDGCGYLFRS